MLGVVLFMQQIWLKTVLWEVDKEANSTCQTVVQWYASLLEGTCRDRSDVHKARESLHNKTLFCLFFSILCHLVSSHSFSFTQTCECWFSHTVPGFSPYCTQQSQAQSPSLGFPPVLHPGLWLGSSELLPLLASQASALPNAHSHIPYPATCTSRFFFSSQPTVPVSLPCNFLSLPFPVKPAITSSFLSLPLFPCDFEPDHSFHSRLSLVKRALGAERCVNLCSSPEQPGTLVIKKVIFYSGLNCSKLPDFYLWI